MSLAKMFHATLFAGLRGTRFRVPKKLSFGPMLEPQANGSLHNSSCGEAFFFFSFFLFEALLIV